MIPIAFVSPQTNSLWESYRVLFYEVNRQNWQKEVPRGTTDRVTHGIRTVQTWWHGMVMWNADMEWWCGMMTWHGDVYDDMECWCGMVTWHDEVAWWLACMHLCMKWVLGHSCIYSWGIVKWLIFEVSGKITHILLIYFIPWFVTKLMHGCNQKQTCHICK